jgi:hypothetical protein
MPNKTSTRYLALFSQCRACCDPLHQVFRNRGFEADSNLAATLFRWEIDVECPESLGHRVGFFLHDLAVCRIFIGLQIMQLRTDVVTQFWRCSPAGRLMPHGLSIRRQRRLGVQQLAAAFIPHLIGIERINGAFKEGASKLAHSKGFAADNSTAAGSGRRHRRDITLCLLYGKQCFQ